MFKHHMFVLLRKGEGFPADFAGDLDVFSYVLKHSAGRVTEPGAFVAGKWRFLIVNLFHVIQEVLARVVGFETVGADIPIRFPRQGLFDLHPRSMFQLMLKKVQRCCG